MKKVTKGKPGYFSYEKVRRTGITLLLFAVPALIFVSGLLYFKSRVNLMTVIAVVGCLPACKSLVGLIMMGMRHPMDMDLYKKIHVRQGKLVMAYEMYLTSYEKSGYVDAFVVCGKNVVGYTSDAKADSVYLEKFVQGILQENRYGAKVKILKDLNPFLERLDSLNAHYEELEKDIPFAPDERYPKLSRDELIMHTILALAL